MYDAIVAEVKNNPQKPDFVFFTGDLAFSGTAAEYQLLKTRLLAPLRAVLPEHCKIFTVPGNHDADRKQVGKPRLWMVDDEERGDFQKVGAPGQRKRAGALLPRFQAYRALEAEVADWGVDWLASEQGSVCQIKEVDQRRIAIVGINTAWLAQDNDDWGQLTAGATMVDAALEQAKAAKPDLLLVLGHHPLAAMMGEKPWSDGARIQNRLQQANAIYLHGHLHVSGGQRTGDAMKSALAIQAPSGFQAPDSKIWRNGVLWGEADLAGGQLIIKPKKWNDDHKEYVLDTDAVESRFRVPGEDAFAFQLPGQAIAPPAAAIQAPEKASAAIAEGWEIIDANALAEKTARRPDAKEMSDWFDGQFPRWETAVAEGVRPRRVVETVVRRFEAAHRGAPQPLAVLLTGAGGEGKSAALLQVAANLVRGEQAWTCLWRSAAAAGLPQDLFASLERRADHAWVVVIDDADNVGQELASALRGIQPRTDVHLILAARDADWSIRGLSDSMWSGAAAFSRVTLAGLDAEDARRIADGWVAYGDEAMGRLHGRTAEQAAHALLGHAQEQAARYEEGALLGALLITREGEDLRTRVIRLMEPWKATSGVGGYSLLDIYAIIAAMHAENQLYLSRGVLAFALKCDEEVLDRGPLRVLRREAMVDGSATYVLTRHRQIAETARDWLVEAGHDMDRLYPFLAKAALLHFLQTRPKVHDVANWCNELPRHFVDRGPSRWAVAVAVAKALFEADPSDAMRLTAYASTLRRTEQSAAALALLRGEGSRFSRHRGVLHEWSVAAGGSEDSGLDAWLAGRSLADDNRVPLTLKQIKLSLAGLGAAFRDLLQTTKQASYASAQAACGRLGLMLPEMDATAREYFNTYQNAVQRPAGKAIPTIDADLATLRAAVVEASYLTEPANAPLFFEGLLGDPEGYRFTMLRAALVNPAAAGQ
jgi:hypothetical protein